MTERKILADDIRILDLSGAITDRLQRAGIDRVTVLRARVQEHGPTAGLADLSGAEIEQLAGALAEDGAERHTPQGLQERAAVAGLVAIREAAKIQGARSIEERDQLINGVCEAMARELAGLGESKLQGIQDQVREALVALAEKGDSWQGS